MVDRDDGQQGLNGWFEDRRREIRDGLRNKDHKAVFSAYCQVEDVFGEDLAYAYFETIILRLIKVGDFSFDGKYPSETE